MDHILLQVADGVLHAIFNRPEKKNAFTDEMYVALDEALIRATEDEEVRVVVLSGIKNCFTAGNDLDDFIARPPRDAQAPVFRFLKTLALMNKPVIAAVEGLAIGVGTTMLLHCDLVYVSATAKFALPFVGLGLVPEAGSSLLLPFVGGHQRAAEKLLLGDPFQAEEAVELGFVSRVLPATEVVQFALQQAARLAQLPVGSVTVTKALMKGLPLGAESIPAPQVLASMDREIAQFVKRVAGPANQEAIQAFKERRAPNFVGLG